MATTATIKKATVYTAPDGTSHPTAKAAAEHVQSTATKAALTEFVQSGVVPHNDDAGFPCISDFELAEFLFNNRIAILAALQPKVEVRQRKPRVVKPKTAPAAAGAA